MRASDLLGRRVRLPDGRQRLVVGLRAVQDGPPRGAMAAIRLDAVIVSKRPGLASLGFRDPGQQGPRVLRALVDRLTGGLEVVPWPDVRDQLRPGPPGAGGA